MNFHSCFIVTKEKVIQLILMGIYNIHIYYNNTAWDN